MKADVTPLYRFMQKHDTQFVIPIYQRNYDWDETQCKQLLDDIIEVGQSDKELGRLHFIGSIVYVCNDEYTTEEITKFVVIDGQQRITTITLMLIALYRMAKEFGDTKLEQTLLEYYLINKNAEDDECKVKLKATENNDRDLQALLNGLQIPTGSYSNIKNNYNYFRNCITEENRDIVFEGFKRLLFVEIVLERNKDNAQKIFESLNSTGLDLSQADLIRNYILMDLEPKEQERLYKQYWSIIEKNCKVEGTSYVSAFVRDCLTIANGEIPNKDAVFVTFKAKYPIMSGMPIEEVLETLRNYSYIYHEFLKPEEIADKDIRKEIRYIKYIEVNVAYPFLLQVMDDFKREKISKPTLIKVLQFVQTYVCRRFILDLPTNALNKIFMSLYRQIKSDDYEYSLYYYILTRSGKVRMPSDSEIRNSLVIKDFYNAKSKMKLYILERMENHNNHEYVPVIDNKTMSVEHIFPQNPDKDWHKELSDKEYKEFAERYVDTIGNLTLSGNNGSLGNRTFGEKKNMNKEGKEQGYRFSRLWLNRFLNEIDKWNEENYNKRTDLMIKRFNNVWPLPHVEGVKETPEQNVCDIDDPTNKEIEYYVFFGEMVENAKFSKMYSKIIKDLYQAQPTRFIEDFAGIIQLTEKKEELRRVGTLNSTFSYELNLPAKDILKRIVTILKKWEITDELVIKFR